MISFLSSLRNHLFLLVLAIFLPAFGLAIYGDYVQRDLEIHQAQDDILRLVHLVAADQDRLIESPNQLLRALANLSAIQQRDSNLCNTLLADLVYQTESIASVAVIDLKGDVWCSSTPIQSPINLADRPYFQRAIQTRGLAVSDYQIGRISGVPVINLAIPVDNLSGELAGVVSASVRLAWLNRLALGAQLPTGSILTITDQSHTILVRYPDPEGWVGKPVTATTLLQAFETQPDGGVVETVETDSVPRLYAYAPLDGELRNTGFYASIGVPTAVAFANIDQAIFRDLVGLVLVAALALIAAWWVGEVMITRRVRALTQATRELTAGDLRARTGQTYGISELTQRFDGMAPALQQQDHERTTSEQTLRKWADIFQNTSVGVLIVEPNSQTLDMVNPVFARMSGYTVEELTCKPISDLWDAASRDEIIAWTRAMRERGANHDTTLTKFVRKDGTIFSVLLDVSVTQDGNGNALYYIITVQDISLLTQAEEDLRHQADELAIITRVSREITEVPNLQAMLASIARLTAEISHSDASGVYLLGADGKYRFASAFGLSENFVKALNLDGIEIGQGAVGCAALEKKPIQVTDVWADSTYAFRDLTITEGFRAVLAVPMLQSGKAGGGIVLWQRQPRTFSPQEQTFLLAIAQQCVNAVENARLYEAEREQREFAEALRDIATALNGTLKVDQVLNHILDNVGKVAAYDLANIVLLENGEARTVGCRGYAERGLEDWTFSKRFSMQEFANMQQVIASHQPFLVPDTRTFAGWAVLPETEWIRSALEVPIKLKGEVIGILNLYSAFPNLFTETQIIHLGTFTDQAALALENARLLAEAEERATQFAALYETTRDLAAQQDLAALLETVVERATEILKASTGDLYLYDLKRGDLAPIAAKGFKNPSGVRLRLGEGMAGRVAQTRLPMIVDDYQTWEHRSPQYKNVPFSAVLQVPLIFRGELIGVLSVTELAPSTRKFTDADMRVLSLFAGQAASAVHNARLLEEARARAEQLALLYDAGLALNSVLEPRTQLEFLFQIATRALHAERAEFFRLDAADQQICLEMSIGHTLPLEDIQAKLNAGLDDKRSLMAAVCRDRLPLYLPDVSMEPRWIVVDPDVRSGVWAPVEHENKLLGVFGVQSTRRDAFTAQHERLIMLFANQVAVALENARLFSETRRRADRLAILNNIAHAVSQTLGLDEMLEIVHQQISAALASDALCIALLDMATNELDFRIRVDEGVRVPPERHPVGTGLRARVIESQKSLLIRDTQTAVDLPPLNLWGSMKSPRSWLGVPMKLDGIVVGIITIESYNPNVYTEEDEQLLITIADQVVVTIQKARLFEETQQRANRLAVLNNVARAVSQTLNLDELLEIIYHQVNTVLKPDAFCMALYDAVAQEFDFRIQIDEGMRSQPERRPATVGLSSRLIATRKSLLIGDGLAVEPPPPDSLWGTMKPARSWLGAPIQSGGTILGIINVQAYTPNVYSAEDEQLLVTIADQVALAIQNARLFEETQQRLIALEAVNKISTVLRAAQTVEEMLPALLDETLAVLGTTAGAISFQDAERDELYQAATRGWFTQTPLRAPASDGIAGMVFLGGKPCQVSEFKTDAATSELARPQIPESWGGAVVPIRAAQNIIGVFAVSVKSPGKINPAQVHWLTTIAEMAGNAIQRARLYEQTEQHLRRLDALHIVDTAISASLDLRVVLNILLGQVTTQLAVDAADILVLNPYDQTLQYSLGHGMRQDTIPLTRLHLGEGYPGRAVLERRTVRVPNLAEATGDPRIKKLAIEGWVAFIVTPLVSKGKVRGVLEIFHHTTLDPDSDWLGFLEILAGQAAIAIDNSALFESLQRSNVDLSLAYDATIEGWARALQLRVESAESHTERVLDMTLRLARMLGVNDAEIEQIRRGVLLHDIGKMGVPDSILAKPGALTEEDWNTLRRHPQYAYDLLKPIDYLRPALDIPYCHHEKWDGTGYPRGLQNTKIPLAARIFAVVDTWDALRSPRPYRAAWQDDRAREYIQSQSGLAFDPQVVAAFLKLLDTE